MQARIVAIHHELILLESFQTYLIVSYRSRRLTGWSPIPKLWKKPCSIDIYYVFITKKCDALPRSIDPLPVQVPYVSKLGETFNMIGVIDMILTWGIFDF